MSKKKISAKELARRKEQSFNAKGNRHKEGADFIKIKNGYEIREPKKVNND